MTTTFERVQLLLRADQKRKNWPDVPGKQKKVWQRSPASYWIREFKKRVRMTSLQKPVNSSQKLLSTGSKCRK